jgi:outer membrane immunogenic protein
VNIKYPKENIPAGCVNDECTACSGVLILRNFYLIIINFGLSGDGRAMARPYSQTGIKIAVVANRYSNLLSVMKKITTLIFLAIVPVLILNAQCPLKKGAFQLNGGLGYSGGGVPVFAGVDFGAFHDVTTGIEASFRPYTEDIYGTKYTSKVFSIVGNGNYHFNTLLEIPKKWDFYAGITMGYYSWSLPADYQGNSSSGFGFGAQIGGRYFFNKRLGLNLEFGGGSSLSGGKIGITYIIN